MFLNNSNIDNIEKSLGGSFTKIAKDVKIEGKFNFKGTVIIDGTITGAVNSEGMLIVSKSGNVESTTKVKDIVIAGDYKGEMIATGLVTIKHTGRFVGNLTQKNESTLIIEKGGLLKGKSIVLNSKKDLQIAKIKQVV